MGLHKIQQWHRVPATECKIDRPFVQDAVTDERVRVIVLRYTCLCNAHTSKLTTNNKRNLHL